MEAGVWRVLGELGARYHQEDSKPDWKYRVGMDQEKEQALRGLGVEGRGGGTIRKHNGPERVEPLK